jgi:hypothetical protein
MPVKGGNLWSKLAGKYYNEHKNDPDIESFTDVLKSPKFREYYESHKNGKKTLGKMSMGKMSMGKKSKKNMGKKFRKSNKNKMMDEDVEEMEMDEDVEDMEMDEDVVKVKKGKKGKKGQKSKKKKFGKMIITEEIVQIQPVMENRENQMKNDYFNGGKR